MIIHVMSIGETPWQIANRYGTTVQALTRENHITNPNMIYVGMPLVIPKAKPTIEVNAYTYQTSARAVQSLQAIGHRLL